jgi:hypothetical protein
VVGPAPPAHAADHAAPPADRPAHVISTRNLQSRRPLGPGARVGLVTVRTTGATQKQVKSYKPRVVKDQVRPIRATIRTGD